MTKKERPVNPLLDQPLEIRMYLESKMREELTNKEILALLNEKFPFVTGVKVSHITAYRNKYVPFYKELMAQRYGKKADISDKEIEDEILEQVREGEEMDEIFSKDEQKKINMLKAFRRVLNELYENYKTVKTSSDESAKKNYLVEIAKILGQIRELEAAEKSFVSAMEEVRKAEMKLTTEQYLDSIKSWWIPRCIDKTKSKEESISTIEKLIGFLNEYWQILNDSETKEDANQKVLAKLYVNQKIKKEEESE